METPDVMAARTALETAVAAATTPDAPAAPVAPDARSVFTPVVPVAPVAPDATNALLSAFEKQALEFVKQNAPAAVAAVEMALPTPKTSWKKHVVSIVEQSVSTFAFAFLGLITATNLSDPTALKAAGVAGGIAVASYLRAVAGTYLATVTVA